MKKFAIVIFLGLFFIATKGLCTTYSAKSTAKQANNQEVIKMDVVPVIKIDEHAMPTSVDDNSVYVAPLIQPANEEKPVLNFNLNNVKNVKKGAIFPYKNFDQSIESVSRYFSAPYDKVFSHLITVLGNSEMNIASYDSESGRIFANYKGEKAVYITVGQYNSENVIVKITPADGIYDIPASVADKIFSDLNKSLAAK